MRSLIFAMAVALVCAAAAQQPGAVTGAVARADQLMKTQLDTCSILVEAVFIKARAGLEFSDSRRKVDECATDGKSMSRAGFDDAKKFIKGKPPAELVDWRVEWTSAFDAASLRDSDTHRAYADRVNEARTRAERASVKLGIALE